MKKSVFLILAVLLALMLLFVACNNDTDPQPPSESTEDTTNSPVEDSDESTSEPETDPHTHAFGEWTTIREATCTEPGEQQRSCDCGKVETQSIDALGHIEVVDAAVAPTCTETGLTEGTHCSICEQVLVVQETVDALGHSYGDWYTASETGMERHDCENCDYYEMKSIAADMLEYYPLADGTYGVMIGRALYLEEIAIPATHDGAIVTKILANGFSDATTLTSILLPTSIVSIEENAFSGCTGLTQVTIPDSVIKIGDYAFARCDKLTSVTIPNSVTKIGAYAFLQCTALSNIIIPNSVTSIGDSAFKNCVSLTSVSIPKEVDYIGYRAFQECVGLQQVFFDGGTPEIMSFAFNGCGALTGVYISDLSAWCSTKFDNNSSTPLCYTKNLYLDEELLTELVIPESVQSINAYAFYGCGNLTSIIIPDGVTHIGESAFRACTDVLSIVIPATTTDIDSYAFAGCTGLDSITITEGVVSIGSYAFEGCTCLSNVTIPNSVMKIGYSALKDCSALTEITLPFVGTERDGTEYTHFGYIFGASTYSQNSSYVPAALKTVYIHGGTDIAEHAFSECANLTSITVADNVSNIGKSAFYNCSRLVSITLPFVGAGKDGTENKHFGYVFGADTYEENSSYVPKSLTKVVVTGGSSIGAGAFRSCWYLTSITIPESITCLEWAAFCGCHRLSEFTIPESVITIESQVFYGCSGLWEIIIPDGVTSIGSYAFYSCEYLRSITIPDSVTSIGNYAFGLCRNLTDVNIGSGVRSIGCYAFKDCSMLSNVTFDATTGWRHASSSSGTTSYSISSTSLSDPKKAALYLRDSYHYYCGDYWYRN